MFADNIVLPIGLVICIAAILYITWTIRKG